VFKFSLYNYFGFLCSTTWLKFSNLGYFYILDHAVFRRRDNSGIMPNVTKWDLDSAVMCAAAGIEMAASN
jgi:hypothetical protein